MDGSPKYVSNGEYGCVFQPNVPCNKFEEISRKYVSKIFKHDIHALEEEIYQKEIEELDPNSEFTIKLYDSCSITRETLRNEIKECKNLRDSKDKKKFNQIIYEYGGVSLSKAATMYDPSILYPAFISLFKGLVVFEEHGKIHLDIKPDNIVFNNETKKMAYIDFGLMTKSDELYKLTPENNISDLVFFMHYPPEFKIAVGIKNPWYIDSNSSIIKVAIKALEKIKPLLNKYNIYENIYKEFEILNEIITNEFESGVCDVCEKYLIPSKVDIYSLGITLLLSLAVSDNNFIILDYLDYSQVSEMIKLACDMILPKSTDRISPKEAYKKFKEIWAPKQIGQDDMGKEYTEIADESKNIERPINGGGFSKHLAFLFRKYETL